MITKLVVSSFRKEYQEWLAGIAILISLVVYYVAVSDWEKAINVISFIVMISYIVALVDLVFYAFKSEKLTSHWFAVVFVNIIYWNMVRFAFDGNVFFFLVLGIYIVFSLSIIVALYYFLKHKL